MGGRPLTALNMVCFPLNCLPLEVLEDILRGGYDKILEAGAALVGGHSIEDSEPKYGLSVTGLVTIEKMVTGRGANPGDCLVLTKPIGTGIIATAVKGEMISADEAAESVKGMATLNAAASETMVEVGVSACTDVTGFSLLGHLNEMLISSNCSAELFYQLVPYYKGVSEMVAMGMIPAGAYRNLEYIRPHITWQGKEDEKEDTLITLADPQTSGGLLVALPEKNLDQYLKALAERNCKGHHIGRITFGSPGNIVIL